MDTRNSQVRLFHSRKRFYLNRIAKAVSEAYGGGVTYKEAQAICGAAWGDYLETKNLLQQEEA